MKKSVTYFFASLCFLTSVSAGSAMAQEQKIGYVNTDYILSQMPAYEGIRQQLRSLSSDWNDELNAMEQEIEQLKEDFEAKEILYTDEMRAEKQQEIQSKIEQRQRFLEQKFGAQGEYFQQQKQLLEPIQREIMSAITTVAERQNVDFIFDRAQNSAMLFANQDWNLTQDVLQELGITLNDSSN
ncbi:MAG TPA: OmpH family outer membrane protein [Balneolaceae bacterium]